MTPGSMASLETSASQSDGSESLSNSSGSSSGSSTHELHVSISPIPIASFIRYLKGRGAPPTLVGISEEAVVQKFVKMKPTMKVLDKGKGLEVTTFTQYEAFPELVDTSVPLTEYEIDTTQTDESPILLVTRSVSLESFPATQGKSPKVKAYRPYKSLGDKDIFENAAIEPQSCGEAYAEFNTAPSSPMGRLSVAERRDMDGPYDYKPRFPSGATMQDFNPLPDHLRGPCFEVSPRTSVLDGPHAIPNIHKIFSIDMSDTSVESPLVRPLEAVQEVSPKGTENCMGQSDGTPPSQAMVPDVGGDAPIPEVPIEEPLAIAKDKNDTKRTHRAVNRFRKSVRKSRSRCLRTPVLVVLVGKELSKPTRAALENIACGLPSGIGEMELSLAPSAPRSELERITPRPASETNCCDDLER